MHKGQLVIDENAVNDDWVRIDTVPSYAVGFGKSAQDLSAKLSTTMQHYYEPVSRTTEEDLFESFALTWGIDNRHNSNAQDIAQHPSYQRIVGMGKDALPMIFKQMRKKPGHWFLALQAITGINPVAPENRGDIVAMTGDWLKWGSDHGFDIPTAG